MFVAARQRELALLRAALRSRSATLRDEVAEHSTVLARPLQLADGVRRAWHWVRVHPEVVAASVVVVVVVRPRRAWTLALWSWKGWRAWLRLRGLIDAMYAGYASAQHRFQSP